MATHAAGTFDTARWCEEPYDEREGAKLSPARLTRTFHGRTVTLDHELD